MRSRSVSSVSSSAAPGRAIASPSGRRLSIRCVSSPSRIAPAMRALPLKVWSVRLRACTGAVSAGFLRHARSCSPACGKSSAASSRKIGRTCLSTSSLMSCRDSSLCGGAGALCTSGEVTGTATTCATGGVVRGGARGPELMLRLGCRLCGWRLDGRRHRDQLCAGGSRDLVGFGDALGDRFAVVELRLGRGLLPKRVELGGDFRGLGFIRAH